MNCGCIMGIPPGMDIPGIIGMGGIGGIGMGGIGGLNPPCPCPLSGPSVCRVVGHCVVRARVRVSGSERGATVGEEGCVCVCARAIKD
jgi:hypothetical protein